MEKLGRIESFLCPVSKESTASTEEETSSTSSSSSTDNESTQGQQGNHSNNERNNNRNNNVHRHVWTKETIPSLCPFCFAVFDYSDPTIDNATLKHAMKQSFSCGVLSPSSSSSSPRQHHQRSPSLLKHRYPWYKRSSSSTSSSIVSSPRTTKGHVSSSSSFDVDVDSLTLPVSSNKCHHVICQRCLEHIHCMIHQERETRVQHHQHHRQHQHHHQPQPNTTSRGVWWLMGGVGGGIAFLGGGISGGGIGRWSRRWLSCPICRIPKAFDMRHPKIDYELCDMLYALHHQRGPSLQLCQGLGKLQRQKPTATPNSSIKGGSSFSSIPLSLWPMLLERVNRCFERQRQEEIYEKQHQEENHELDTIMSFCDNNDESKNSDQQQEEEDSTNSNDKLMTPPTREKLLLPPRTFHVEILHDLVRHRLVETNEFYGN